MVIAVTGIGNSGDAINVGGDQTVRVAIRRASLEKIAHKVDRMGDYKPEFVYEDSGIVEVDPRDDAAISALNQSAQPKFVALADDLDLPVISGYRLLAAKLEPRHPILLKDQPNNRTKFRGRISADASDRRDKYRLPSVRRNWRCRSCPGRTWPGTSTALILQYLAGGRDTDLQNRLCRLPFLWSHAFQSADDDGENQSRDVAPQGGEDRNHGLHCEWARRNGRC